MYTHPTSKYWNGRIDSQTDMDSFRLPPKSVALRYSGMRHLFQCHHELLD